MSHLQLQDKVILITGALGAAGHSAIKLFLEKGAFIAACDIKAEEGFAEQEALRQQFGSERLLYVRADMTKEEEVQQLIGQTEQYFGRLDGSYHNAYVNKYQLIANQSLEDWEASIRGTLTSTFLVCKYAAQLMIRSGGGSMVNTSSILGTKALANNAAYGAGKAGLEQLTRIIAVEYAQYGIRANAVVPGDFKADHVLAKFSEGAVNKMKELTLLGRSGRTNEINEVAAFLLSDASSYVTGSLYPVTGGIWI